MKDWQREWDRFWWQPIPADSLRIFKALIGALLLINWLAYSADLNTIFGVDIGFLYFTILLSCLALIFNLAPQLAAFMFLVATYLIKYDAADVKIYGGEVILTNCLFWLMFVPRTGTFPIWPKRMMQMILTCLWLGGGLSKLKSANWQAGIGFYNSLTSMELGYFPEVFLQSAASLRIMNWTVPVLEILFAVLIWIPRTRRMTIYAAAIFHIGIMIVLKLYIFQLAALSLLLLFHDSFDRREAVRYKN